MGKVVLCALTAIALAGCGGGSPQAEECRPTSPSGDAPGASTTAATASRLSYGRTASSPPARCPDGGSYAAVKRDGSIVAKLGWWRGAEGRLTITGERTDAAAPPLRADVPDGYGPTGFQATALTFASAGCWNVIGRVGDERLTFTVLVRKRSLQERSSSGRGAAADELRLGGGAERAGRVAGRDRPSVEFVSLAAAERGHDLALERDHVLAHQLARVDAVAGEHRLEQAGVIEHRRGQPRDAVSATYQTRSESTK